MVSSWFLKFRYTPSFSWFYCEFMIELIFAFAIGTTLGVLAGLIPGLHQNNFIPIILGASFLFEPMSAAIVLIAAAVVNSFVQYIPSILLGAPEDSSALSVLPGHRLLLQGRGYEAIRLTTIGNFLGAVFAVFSLPLFTIVVPWIYDIVHPNLFWILSFVVVYMIFSEKSLRQIFLAVLVFCLSGALGLIVLNNYPNDFLFPLLAGLFGLPMLLLSFQQKTKFPENFSFETEKLKKRMVASAVSIGSLAGIIAGLLPGVGNAQATLIAQEAVGSQRLSPEISARKFLISIGSVNMADFIYSLFALFLISRPRSGIAVAVEKLMPVGSTEILIFIGVILLSAIVGAVITTLLARRALFFMRRVFYPRLSMAVFVFILGLVFIFTGSVGIFVSLTALAIGLVANLSGIKRSHAMGCLLLPTILFFAGF